MNLIRESELASLAEGRDWPLVSIFLPTNRGGPGLEANRIRLKNQLRQVEVELQADHMRSAEIDDMLQPARRLVDETLFWERSSDGLALFASTVGTQFFHVPLELPELVTIGNRFVVWPLLPMLTTSGHFFVLALSQDETRLFQATRSGMEEVTVDGLPPPPRPTMPRPRRPQVAFAGDRVAAGTGAGAVFHGVGGGVPPDRKALLLQHFRKVDRAVRHVLAREQAPLVIVGVGYLQALYDKANTYPHLLAEGVGGSPRELTLDQIRRYAWEIAEPVLRRPQSLAANEYLELRGTGRTVNEPVEVLAAAEQGRVGTLFVSSDARGWRATGLGSAAVRLEKEPTDGELLDLAALATLRNSGAVFAVSSARMPDDTLAAATLRY